MDLEEQTRRSGAELGADVRGASDTNQPIQTSGRPPQGNKAKLWELTPLGWAASRNHGVDMRLVIGLLAFTGVVGYGLVMLIRATGLFPPAAWPT